MIRYLEIKSRARTEFIDITAEIRSLLKKANVNNGICHLFVLHTTAGITVNEGADPAVHRDINTFLNKLVPQDLYFTHREGNSDAHIKSTHRRHFPNDPDRERQASPRHLAIDLFLRVRWSPTEEDGREDYRRRMNRRRGDHSPPAQHPRSTANVPFLLPRAESVSCRPSDQSVPAIHMNDGTCGVAVLHQV